MHGLGTIGQKRRNVGKRNQQGRTAKIWDRKGKEAERGAGYERLWDQGKFSLNSFKYMLVFNGFLIIRSQAKQQGSAVRVHTGSQSSILSCILFIPNLLILIFNNIGTLKCVIKIDIIWITISLFTTEWLYLIGL